LTIKTVSQIEQILQINALRNVTKEVVEAAHESLVIGLAWDRQRGSSAKNTEEITPNNSERHTFAARGITVRHPRGHLINGGAW